jgi:thymidylate kinase
MHDAEISYCHWKGNEHVLRGMRGEGDMDVLVEKSACRKLNEILNETGFKRFVATATNGFPGVEDYLAMDRDTGKLVHLHLHYQLIAGETHLEGYHLPWEYLVLSTRRFDTETNIYTTTPDVEMLLLLVRAALRLRPIDRFAVWLGRSSLPDRVLREFSWLKQRIDSRSVVALAEEHLGTAAAGIVSAAIDGRLTVRRLIALRWRSMPTLRRFRTYGVIEAGLLRRVREANWLLGGLSKRYLHLAIPFRRTVPTGGRLIAFMGCDGAGKSTLAKSIAKWLAWKFDVVPVYFGSGDGPSSAVRWPLDAALLAYRLACKFRSKRRTSGNVDQQGHVRNARRGRLYNLAKGVWAIVLAYEKRNKLRKVTKARNRGMIVICDRYPQNQIMGFNDGPLLSHWHNHRIKLIRRIAEWEAAPYRWAEVYPPDLVIKLYVAPEVALQRKPDTGVGEVERRTKAIREILYPPPTDTANINADANWDEVLAAVKCCIWDNL